MILLCFFGVVISGYVAISLYMAKRAQQSPEPLVEHRLPLCHDVSIQVPQSWSCHRTPHQIVLQSLKKDGVLTIQKFPWAFEKRTLEQLIHHFLLNWDKPFHQERINDKLDWIEGQGTDPYTDERAYFILYRARIGENLIIATYKSSVLYALVDGYQVRGIVESIFKSSAPSQPPEKSSDLLINA